MAPKRQLSGEYRTRQDNTAVLLEHWPSQREPSGYMFPIGIFAVVVNLRPLDNYVEDGGEGAIDIINGKGNRGYEPNRGKR